MFIALPVFNKTLPGRHAPLDTWDYLVTLMEDSLLHVLDCIFVCAKCCHPL